MCLLCLIGFVSVFSLIYSSPAYAVDSSVSFSITASEGGVYEQYYGFEGNSDISGSESSTINIPAGAAIDYLSGGLCLSGMGTQVYGYSSGNGNNYYSFGTADSYYASASVSNSSGGNFSGISVSVSDEYPPWVVVTPPYQNDSDSWPQYAELYYCGPVESNIPVSSADITVSVSGWTGGPTGKNTSSNWGMMATFSGTAYYIMPPSLSYTTLTSNAIILNWTNPGSNNYNIYENGALLANVGNVNNYIVSGLSPGTQYTFNVTAQSPEGHAWTGLSNTVSVTTPSLILQYNGNQTYWYQQVNFGNGVTSGVDYHVLVTELDFTGNASSTTHTYDIGDVSTYSVPLQSGKYYEIQEQEASPIVTAWSPPVYVWNAPAMGDNGASIAQVTSTTATIKWEQVAPNQQMEVLWKPDSGSSWSNSGALAVGTFSYQITGLSPNTKYDLVLTPAFLPDGGTAWWASQQSFYTDSAPGIPVVTINSGQQATNVANATVQFTASSVDSPIVAYGLSNDGKTYKWFPYTTGQNAGLLGSYYANPSDVAYGQIICDPFYVGTEIDSQVNVPDGTTAPAITNDPSDVNWGAAWMGSIWIAQPGTYNFAVPSDDGASLTINGQVLVQDWNYQGQPVPGNESGTITFSSPGWYPVLIHYFQGDGASGISFDWMPPGTSSYSLVPSSDLIALQNGPDNQQGNSVNISTNWGLSGNGAVSVYVEVMTADGTVSQPGIASINLLTGAQNPVLKLTLDNGVASTTDPNLSYVLTATGAGLPTQGQMQYQINGGAWSSWTTLSQTGTISLGSNAQPGVYTVTVQVQDANGLESQASAQITLQPAPPPGQTGSSTSGTPGIYENKNVYFVNNQNVSLTVSNTGNPVMMDYSFDGANFTTPQPYSQNLSLTLPKGDGLTPVYVDTLDSNNVIIEQTITYFVLDTIPPTIESLVTQNGADATSGSSINLVVQVKDNITTAGNFEYSINGGTEYQLPVSGVISAPVTNPGINNITVDVYDQAGNMASDTIQIFKLD